MNPSPHGRFPNALRSVRTPASGIAVRPVRSRVRSEPFGQVIFASDAASRRFAISPPLRRSPSMSALITRASISSVAPGRVAIRVPASLARLRAAVCESDWTVGASTTSAAAIASATVRGGSPACEARSVITARVDSAPASWASARIASPIGCVAGLQIVRTSSPSRTPRQSRTTARTAFGRSPSLMAPAYAGGGAWRGRSTWRRRPSTASSPTRTAGSTGSPDSSRTRATRAAAAGRWRRWIC